MQDTRPSFGIISALITLKTGADESHRGALQSRCDFTAVGQNPEYNAGLFGGSPQLP